MLLLFLRGNQKMKLLARSLATGAFFTLAVGCTPASKSDSAINATSTPSIIGGTNVSEGAALQKSIVGIYDTKKGALCTGSLLDNNIVLTAAHCIGESPQDHLIVFAADLATIFQSQDKNLLLQKVRQGVKMVVNPSWGKKGQSAGQAWGDTALIRFKGDVPAGFAPATVLASAAPLADDTVITVAGYGVNSDVLTEINKADYPDFKDRELKGELFCEKAEDGNSEKCYKEDLSGEGHLRTTELKVAGYFNDTEIAFDQQHGQASCEGDSGGPAYVKQANGEYHLFGVTSRGTRGCNGYVLYSDIASPKLANWLAQATAQVSK
jgi:secreted trypsin-like serine protease